MAKRITIYGNTTTEGFRVKRKVLDGDHSETDAWNTAVQTLRHRSEMLLGAGYLFLDVGTLDEKRLL